MRRERVFDVGAELFCDEPIGLVCGEEVHLYDATRKVRPPVVFGRDHTGAFVAAFEETVRELY